ncbi:hypothetical protein JXA32_14125 [Candidatus Sumerlaeota bacterium]|nr:hypothetical protein [Candidatus Sumerlaeota bacterium]
MKNTRFSKTPGAINPAPGVLPRAVRSLRTNQQCVLKLRGSHERDGSRFLLRV